MHGNIPNFQLHTRRVAEVYCLIVESSVLLQHDIHSSYNILFNVNSLNWLHVVQSNELVNPISVHCSLFSDAVLITAPLNNAISAAHCANRYIRLIIW